MNADALVILGRMMTEAEVETQRAEEIGPGRRLVSRKRMHEQARIISK
jgi:hypothetical protein